MNDNLLKISLIQGKLFNTYQTKIKKTANSTIDKTFKKGLKEGFVTSEQEMLIRPEHQGYKSVLKNQEELIDSSNTTNQKSLDELKELQAKYNDLMLQYITIQTSISETSLTNINRVSSNNPYLNKNILFTDGTICYVTNQGIAKPYLNRNVFNNTAGKNGCPPKQYITLDIAWSSKYIKGSTIPTNPPLIVGSNMVEGQSCGYEGDNVYASTLINNSNSSFIGCYNDKPPSTNINVIPVMNSSGKVNGFTSVASSVYMTNNTYGAWAAFDQNPKTFWASDNTSINKYNDATGVYEGSTNVKIANVGSVSGEFLQILMPGINTSSVQNITVTQYSLSPRLDNCCLTTRNPNSWYVLGLKNNQWYQLDRQQNKSFTNGTPKVYNISNPEGYSAYMLLVDKVGNDDQKTNRYCVQVAEWNLFANSDTSASNDQRAMISNPDFISYTSFDKCQEFAINNGYQYFGLQDVQPDGKAACMVSNDITRTQMYGDATSQITAIPLWSSNTSSGIPNTFQLFGTGQIAIIDTSGKVISYVNDVVGYCENWGTIFITSATYGGNCNAPIGNVSDKVAGDLKCNFASSCSIPISNQTFGDPNSECAKSFDIEYKCGGKSFTKNLANAEGQTMILDCQSHINENCYFYIILQDDGNLCIYKGKEPTESRQELVWSTGTNGQQKSINPDWEARKGKYGRNYLKSGETLASDEWIGSTTGSTRLIMQKDGNLVLYSSEIKSGCKIIDNKKYGSGWVNAVYKLDAVGNPSSLGSIGYVDSDSNLKEYPVSMVGFTNDYQIHINTDSPGNDLLSITANNEEECKIGCNNNTDCGGYVYNPTTTTCWLKSRNQFNKQPNKSSILGIRNPSVKGSNTCSNKIINVDTIQYDNYVKGNKMTSDTECNKSMISKEDQIKFDSIKNELYLLGQDIATKMENLYNKDEKIYEKFNMNAEQFKKNLEKYKITNTKIRKEMNLQSNNNIEGMENYITSQNSKNLNIDDLNGMLNDTDLRVLQENYKYILWSILAVGLVTITVNTMKK